MRLRVRLPLGVSVALAAMVLARAGVPAVAQAPLPDRDRFFEEAKARVASNMARQSRFSYRERVTELRFNPFGRMGTNGVIVADVYPGATEALTCRRIIERNGLPVPADDLAAQDRDCRAALDDWQRQLAREGQSAREARLQRDAADRARDQTRLAEALELFDFTMERRAVRDGRPAIVIAFTPRADARPRSREGRIARNFAGRVWIDEADYELAHMEARAVDDVSIGYGLIARLSKGSTVVFSREKIHGTWLPVATRFQATGRALLVRHVEIDFVRTYSDYRLFDPSELPARLGWR